MADNSLRALVEIFPVRGRILKWKLWLLWLLWYLAEPLTDEDADEHLFLLLWRRVRETSAEPGLLTVVEVEEDFKFVTGRDIHG